MKALRRLLEKIPGGTRHWATVFVLIGLGSWAGHWLGERDVWIRLRYKIYERQQEIFSPRTRNAASKRTSLVLVGDDDYWKGEELARRVPINRDYLARLVRAVATANPQVIALDFNLASPVPDGSLREHSAYAEETKRFVAALKEVARIPRGPTVILARTIEYDPETDRFIAQPAVYDEYDLPRGRVRSGYIELPFDLRQVPLPVELLDRSKLDSFSSAIVRASGADQALKLAEAGEGQLPYGSFHERSSFPTYPAQAVLEGDTRVLQNLEHDIVLVGAGWSRFAYGIGGSVDITESPLGTVPKVYLHANYIEALLDPESQIFKPLPEWIAITIEVVLSLVIAVVFALRLPRRLTFLGALSACLLVIVFTYFSYQNLGLFFDFFIPLVLLACHSVYEQAAEWREAAHKYEALAIGDAVDWKQVAPAPAASGPAARQAAARQAEEKPRPADRASRKPTSVTRRKRKRGF